MAENRRIKELEEALATTERLLREEKENNRELREIILKMALEIAGG